MCHACLSKDATQDIEISCNCSCASSLRFGCKMVDYSVVESPESEDCTPYDTPLPSPSSSSGYETCLSLLDEISLFDIDFEISDGGQDVFTNNINEDVEELPDYTGTGSSSTKILKHEGMPQVSPDIERDNRYEGLLTGDGTVGSLSSIKKNENLHEGTEKCKQCKYLLTEGDAICNFKKSTGTYPLHISISKCKEINVLPAEIEKTEHHQGVCIQNGAFHPSKDIGTSYLLEDISESLLKENEVIKSSSVEIEKVEGLSDYANLLGCATTIGTSEGALFVNDTTYPLEYVSGETSNKIKPSEDSISTKCDAQPPDDPGPRIKDSECILPEEGSTAYHLQLVVTESSNVYSSESNDGFSSSASTTILVEHIENMSFEGICTSTDSHILPHEEKITIEEKSLSSSGCTEIPVLSIVNDLLEGVLPGTDVVFPPENISTKHIEEGKQPNISSQKVDDDVLLDENSEGSTFQSDATENILPEPLISNFSTDPDLWTPPEFDEYGSQLQSVDSEEEASKHFTNVLRQKHKDVVSERATVEVMNGEFKRLLKRFMVAEGFSVPSEDGDEGPPDSWLRVVRVLSWQAALLIKPDLVAGKEMDPCLYVKIKCIASGTRIQSEVIDGLVFKKSAAHKRMPTRIENPRLLLLQEVLDHSISGLSSMRSIEHDKNVLKKTIETMLDTCRPNIILVQKAASRGAQELITKKDVTLILDMKLHRMERIVRCIGSKAVCLDEALLMPDVVKQCSNFRIEKFVEDINSERKNRSKSLLFLEGLPKPLGCTILLRGANIEELKRIKRVLHYAVFAAHHLVRVTSFLSDQQLLASCNDALRKQNSLLIFSEHEPISPKSLTSDSSTDRSTLSQDLEVPIYEEKLHSVFSDIPLGTDSTSLASCNDPLKKQNSLLIFPEPELISPSKSLTSDSSTNRSTLSQDLEIPISEEELHSVHSDIPLRTDSTSQECVPTQTLNEGVEGTKTEINRNEEIRIIGDPEKDRKNAENLHSALIIAASRNIIKRKICEERHFSRINYYGNCDMSLGTQLKDLFLSEKHKCSVCGDEPEAHVHVYTQRNGRITILVTTLPPEVDLSRGTYESQDEIWMWTRCWRCKKENRPPGPTERFILSDSARSISFVKFLELSFSRYLPGKKLPCGHLMYRDGLRYFGMGSKVAMLRYTPIELYEACTPPAMLEIHDPNSLDWLQKEALLVNEKRSLLFSEIKSLVEVLKQKYKNDAASGVIFHDSVLSMAQKIDAQVEVYLTNPMDSAHSEMLGVVVHDILSLNWLYQTLLLETYVWDCRLSCFSDSLSQNQEKHSSSGKGSNETPSSTTQDKDVSIWAPFSELLTSYKQELQAGSFHRFELINKYKPRNLPPIQNQIQYSEPQRKFIVGHGGNIFSFSEDEVSSLIAYSLCFSEEKRKEKRELEDAELDTLILLKSLSLQTLDENSSTSKHWHREVHIRKGNFPSSKGEYTITCLYEEFFRYLRKKWCPSESIYISSLSRCKRWDAQGGKTKAFFSKTMDDRFIIKGIKKIEFDSFLQFAPHYFNYMSKSIEKGNPTCLAKILGIYQIVENRNGKETRMDLMVMENLMYGRHLSRQYDLKGAIHARHVAGSDSCTFLDQNFIEDMRKCPIYLSLRTKRLLERAIWNDTSFLTSINVMDYSLLLGVDSENRAIAFGIIDYLRQYTWDKKFETFVKTSLVVPKNVKPTVIGPKEYKKRFRSFMHKWILVAPDGWGSEMPNSPWVLS